MSLFRKFVEYNLLMVENNMKINPYHPYGSKWWTWPLMLSHGTLFWEGRNRHVWSMGNPFVWWISTLGIVWSIIKILRGDKHADKLLALVIGWAVSYFPFALIPRSLWSYHYLVPLIFAIVNLMICFDGMNRGWMAFVVMGTLGAWGLVGPVVYGMEVSNEAFHIPFKAWRGMNPKT
jgi:dolichyl-phosphate-mannose-protein mannosyltransferase